jgi:hypothetical protein
MKNVTSWREGTVAGTLRVPWLAVQSHLVLENPSGTSER